MPSEDLPGERRPAVVYVGPLDPARDGAGGADRPLIEEALRQAEAAGLAVPDPVAETVAEADAQLAAHPDAVLLVAPRTDHHDVWPAPGRALWGLLRRGAVLRACGAAGSVGGAVDRPAGVAPGGTPDGSAGVTPDGSAGTPPSEAAGRTPSKAASSIAGVTPDGTTEVAPDETAPVTPDGSARLTPGQVHEAVGEHAAVRDPGEAPAPPALLVVDFPTVTTAATGRRNLTSTAMAAGHAQESPRVAECRAFAHRLGLRGGPVLATSTQWALGALQLSAGQGTTTVVVHPAAAPPEPGSADALLMRWLRAGHEIRPVRTAAPDRRRVSGGELGQDFGQDRERPDSERWIRLESDRLARPARREHADAAERGMERRDSHRDREWDRQAEVERLAEIVRDGLGSQQAGDEDQALFRRVVSDRYRGLDAQISAPSASSAPSAAFARSGPPFRPAPGPRRSGPLPHDGLFIRRNNAFGTRSVLGVRDLIEQGVIVGQEQIRFDDFVAARTDQVPGPGPGEAVAVSHGLAAVPSAFKADEATTHLLELTLRAGDSPPAGTPREEALPVNFVFVVDTSYSMQGEKLDTVRQALQGLYDRLRPADCLGIITFDTHVRTPLAAVPKGELPPERFAEVVSGLTAGGGTDIHLGVQYGLSELRRHSAGGNTVDCLYLFSDGDPTSGFTDWVEIRTRIAAELRGDVTLSCFGFGSDARMPELSALAGLSGGHSTFVTRPEQIGTDLLADLTRRDHLAAIDIQLRLDIAADVEIRHLYGHDLVGDPRARQAVLRDAGLAAASARATYGAEALPDIITDEHGIRIFAPDLAFGETYWIVLEIAVPPGRGLPGVGTATVQFVDTVAREGLRRDIDLSAGLTLAEETVKVHAVGLWTSEVTFAALDDLYERDRDTARKRLSEHIQILKSVHLHLPAKEFVDDQITLSKLATLAGSLDTVRSYSDPPRGGAGLAPAMVAISEFGRVRSGTAWRA
ncbi:VWA domain-containing protein [Streptomyces sp. NPDC049813]|uniref:VWA domain-containing protein n=1 Tax=Streptomyces sp. NPDC049813 TaxID=3365597 RepID=UPI003788B6D5